MGSGSVCRVHPHPPRPCGRGYASSVPAGPSRWRSLFTTPLRARLRFFRTRWRKPVAVLVHHALVGAATLFPYPLAQAGGDPCSPRPCGRGYAHAMRQDGCCKRERGAAMPRPFQSAPFPAYSAVISIAFFLAFCSGIFGSVTVRTPFLKAALTFSLSTLAGTGMTRWNSPYDLSTM